MQLGWPWGRKQHEPALDTAPLKKIVAVSDEYWEALYSPITNSVARSLGVFEKQKGKLYSDYVDQFVRLVRRSKGTVQDDPLIVHLHTFSLCIAFSSLYVARLCHSFDFTAISKSKKTKGERSLFYPWINVPTESELKLAKVSRLYPAYVHAISIFNTMINDTGWKWLHSKPEVLKGLFDSIYSNGEKGPFSGILADMWAAPIGRSVDQALKAEVSEIAPNDNETSEVSGSLDDLISGLGGGDDEVSLDDLLEGVGSKQDKQKSGNALNSSEASGNSIGDQSLDLSIFDNEPSATPNNIPADASLGSVENKDLATNTESFEGILPPQNEIQEKLADKPKVNSSSEALDEFTAFLASTTPNTSNDIIDAEKDSAAPAFEDSTRNETESDADHSDSSSIVDNAGVKEGESSLLFSSESSITTDLLKWCLEQVKELPSQNGVHVLMRDNDKALVIERDKGVMAFVHSDYDLDKEAAYNTVAEEVLTDLAMSQSWIENEEGGDIWEVSIEGTDVNVLLLNIPVPTSYISLDTSSYKWLVKNGKVA